MWKHRGMIFNPSYVLARDIAMFTLYAIVENFGYRQWNNWWRLQGFWQALTKKTDWGAMPRKQFHSEE